MQEHRSNGRWRLGELPLNFFFPRICAHTRPLADTRSHPANGGPSPLSFHPSSSSLLPFSSSSRCTATTFADISHSALATGALPSTYPTTYTRRQTSRPPTTHRALQDSSILRLYHQHGSMVILHRSDWRCPSARPHHRRAAADPHPSS